MSEAPRTGRLGGFELLAQEEADEAYRNVMLMRDQPFGDSPIEYLLFAALVAVSQRQHRSIVAISRYGKDVPSKGKFQSLEDALRGEEMFGQPSQTAFVEKQVQVAGWRVDFVILYPNAAQPRDEDGRQILSRLIIECDGHAFHERTKEQAARDRSRDRIAQLEGLPIFRFTGSEIWNDPAGCADEILEYMERG